MDGSEDSLLANGIGYGKPDVDRAKERGAGKEGQETQDFLLELELAAKHVVNFIDGSVRSIG